MKFKLKMEEIRMKKQMIVLVLILSLALVLTVPAEAALRPNIYVSGFGAKDGAFVGKDFVLSINLTNLEEGYCAKHITTNVQAQFPFIMDGLSTVQAGDLCAGSVATVNIPMKIDPTATGGFYQIAITNTYETAALAQYSSTDTINLFVSGSPKIDAYVIGSEPIDVYAGDTASVTIAIQNNGAFQAQSVTGKLSADSPLKVVWAGSFASIGTLNAKEQKTSDFSIEVPKDAAAKDYDMDLEMKYLDENLQQQTKTIPLVFHVKEKALFVTSDAGTGTLYANDNGKKVKLTLKNIGTDDAHKVKVKILPQYPFSTDGSVRYIELLPTGGESPVDFSMTIDKDGTPGTYGLDMLLDYEDVQGKKMSDTAKVSITISEKDVIRAVFIDYWFVWLALLILVLLIARKVMAGKKKS